MKVSKYGSLGVITEAVTNSFISFQFLIFITIKSHIVFHTMIYKLQKGSKDHKTSRGLAKSKGREQIQIPTSLQVSR